MPGQVARAGGGAQGPANGRGTGASDDCQAVAWLVGRRTSAARSDRSCPWNWKRPMRSIGRFW